MELSFECPYCGHRFSKFVYSPNGEIVRCPKGECRTKMTQKDMKASDKSDRDPFGYNKGGKS